MWFSVVCTLIENDTRHHSGQNVVHLAGGAGSPSHNALRINYIINRRWSRDLLVVSGVHGVEFTVS